MFDWNALKLHDDYSIWCYDAALGFAVEVATESVKKVLPKGLYPFEVRPGISLLMINVLSFTTGNHRFDKAFREVTFSVNVIPDLYLAGKLPKFAVYVLNIGVTDLDFSADPYNTDKLPFYSTQIQVDIDSEAHAVRCWDERGPIFELHNISKESHFDRKEDFFQVFASSEGDLYHGAMTLEAEAYEHQKSGVAGRVFDHPILRGLEMKSEAAENFMQLFTQDGTLGIQHYYRLQRAAP
jgi:hypothetical protein